MAIKIRILFIGLLAIILSGYLIEYVVEELEKKIEWEEILTEEVTGGKDEVIFVERVIDGDTIELTDGSIVRYIGINTMEVNSKDKDLLNMAIRSTEKNKELVEGKKVVLEKDVSEIDKYGRLLRYVYVDGKMVNQILLEEGLAQVATYPPDIKYQELFLEIQRKAVEEKIGFWGLK